MTRSVSARRLSACVSGSVCASASRRALSARVVSRRCARWMADFQTGLETMVAEKDAALRAKLMG